MPSDTVSWGKKRSRSFPAEHSKDNGQLFGYIPTADTPGRTLKEIQYGQNSQILCTTAIAFLPIIAVQHNIK